MRARTSSILANRSLGLSLVEVLVGVAIGLIGVVAIFQAIAVWSRHTSTTTAGGDAQVAGTLALFNIERDVKQAGHGFGRAISQVMGCDVAATDTTPARAFNFGLRPVEIAASAGGAPDSISILYGNSSFYVEEGDFTDATASTKKMRRRGGFKIGDVAVVAVNPGASAATAACQLVQLTDDTDPDGYTVAHSTVPFVSFYAASSPAAASRFNSAVAPGALSGTMYNLGPDPRLDVWSIQNNHVLVRGDSIHATAPIPIGEGVINLKAEYGVDGDGDGVISPAEWQTAAPADWRRVLAIRVAVLVRSRQFEKHGDAGAASGVLAVTPTVKNPYYFGDAVNRKFLMTNVDGSADTLSDTDVDPNNWRFYRYRVYERVIPLRNMLWGNWG
ncbi:MAG TPA: PilW family protein [Caldimonas sp.]|jgi:type IV pilus assembly protein PilW